MRPRIPLAIAAPDALFREEVTPPARRREGAGPPVTLHDPILLLGQMPRVLAGDSPGPIAEEAAGLFGDELERIGSEHIARLRSSGS